MILFVFEGKKTEPYIMQIIKELYFKNDNKHVFISYCGNLQALFNELSRDSYLDLVGLLKENEIKHPEVEKKLQNYKSYNFSEIYLFFDYDIKKLINIIKTV